MTRFFLVSHGETDWNALGRYQGHADIPLNERGRCQALKLRQHLAKVPVHRIVASDLSRAAEMAQILALPHELTVHFDARLRELHFGDWEGRTHAEVAGMAPDILARWREQPHEVSPPRGESLTALARRLRDFLHDLDDFPPEGTILVVAHRGSLRVLLCLLLGWPVARHWEFRLGLASFTEVEIQAGQARIVHLQETFDDS